jgi:hypothetical protein
MEWSEEGQQNLDRVKAYMSTSTDPYLFASPRDAGVHTLEQPLAEFRYALRDVVALIPEKDERQPEQGEVLQSIVIDLAIDYPQYRREGIETLVYMGYTRVLEQFKFGPTKIEEHREIGRKEVSRERVSKDEVRINYEVEYEVVASYSAKLETPVTSSIQALYPALVAIDELKDAPKSERQTLVMDLWSRLGAVPRSGSSRTRAALLLIASNFESYAKYTCLAAMATRAIELPEDELASSVRDIQRGKSSFKWYRDWLNTHLDEDVLGPMHEVFVRRNQFAHHGGTAQQSYVNQFPDLGNRVGRPIPLTRDYLLGIADTSANVATNVTRLLLSRTKSG